jgi:hypothetical protein
MANQASAHIARTGADIQDRKPLVRMHQIPHHSNKSGMTTEPPVDG